MKINNSYVIIVIGCDYMQGVRRIIEQNKELFGDNPTINKIK